MKKQRPLHRRIHTFSAAFSNARSAHKDLQLEPNNGFAASMLDHYLGLARKWAQTSSEKALVASLSTTK
jgi:acyl carrier protein phosphodiesterase